MANIKVDSEKIIFFLFSFYLSMFKIHNGWTVAQLETLSIKIIMTC